MKDVIGFLKRNGFKRIAKNLYANDYCNVVFEGEHYAIVNNEDNTMYSVGLNIYWLIGVLTYYGYMDKNYKL